MFREGRFYSVSKPKKMCNQNILVLPWICTESLWFCYTGPHFTWIWLWLCELQQICGWKDSLHVLRNNCNITELQYVSFFWFFKNIHNIRINLRTKYQRCIKWSVFKNMNHTRLILICQQMKTIVIAFLGRGKKITTTHWLVCLSCLYVLNWKVISLAKQKKWMKK